MYVPRHTVVLRMSNLAMTPQTNIIPGLQNLSQLKDAEMVLGCALQEVGTGTVTNILAFLSRELFLVPWLLVAVSLSK